MRVTAPFTGDVPALEQSMLEADPLDPQAGHVEKGKQYDVAPALGKQLVAQGWKQTKASASTKPAEAPSSETPSKPVRDPAKPRVAKGANP